MRNSENLERLLRELFGDRKLTKLANGDIRLGSRGSLSVSTTGEWYSFEQGVGGKSIVSLVCLAKDCSYFEARQWLKDSSFDGAFSSQRCRPTKNIDNLESAWHIWISGEDIADTVGEYYLRHTRRIPIIPSTALKKIRFRESLPHPNGNLYPALLFKIQNTDKRFAGILRIYLSSKTGDKIPNHAKLRLGSLIGSSIQFSPPSKRITVCEGPEDALSILCAFPNMSVWCGIGSSLRSIELPRSTKHVTIACDNDHAGRNIGLRLAERLLLENRKVQICTPTKAKDFNELLRK